MEWAAGTVLAGKYALTSKLGQGGMGAVWRAEHVQLRSPVAIKLIDPSIASDPEALSRFMREAQSAAALRSPHVVQILDFGADQGVPYIAMELLEGESLAGRLERFGRLTPEATSHVLTQVVRAVSKAHEAGIVHRDLKPDNIFLVRNDEEEVAKVLDFGIAKAQNALGAPTGSSTRTGAILGTPYYMSPEQAEGTKLVDHRSDVWALGVIAFECVLGRRPFDAGALGGLLLAICSRPLPVPSSIASVPAGFDAWFARACAREPSDRFQSARELVTDLRRVCGNSVQPTAAIGSATQVSEGGTPYVAAPPTTSPYSSSVGVENRRGLGLALTLGGVFLAVAIAGGVAVLLRGRTETASSESRAPSEPVTAVPPAAAPAPSPEVAPLAVAPAPAPPPSASAPSSAASAVPNKEPPRSNPPRAHAGTPAPASTPTAEATATPPKPPPKATTGRVDLGI